MLLIIEVIDEKTKLEPLLPDLKMMINANGLVTIHEVDTI
jgi:PII-like signaling protein